MAATHCSFCGAPLPVESAFCPQCGNAIQDGSPPSQYAAVGRSPILQPSNAAAPGVVLAFRTIAVLQALAATIVAFTLQKADGGSGLQVPEFVAPVTLVGGLLSALIFWGIGDCLLYLRDIRDSLRR